MLNIVIFGPPGSGKGTQSAKIVEKYKLIHLSTGDILREEIKAKSEVGLKIREIIDKGNLVPDELVLEELSKRAEKYVSSNGFIFDGFPRTVPQSDMLDKMLAKHNISITMVLAIDVDEEELFARLMKRAVDSGRTDDNAETVRHRIEVYKNQTYPLIEHYKKQGKLFSIDGVATVDVVFQRITDAVGKLEKGKKK